jgi:hypothetical protein
VRLALSAQELQVALTIAEGITNRQAVSAELEAWALQALPNGLFCTALNGKLLVGASRELG